ncbi:MAG: zinc ribbon domain-containing protein [Dehalococcoidia bacterium]|nr:zinc ribbon domain-containing protein [Dehalococcoidia bacterium]
MAIEVPLGEDLNLEFEILQHTNALLRCRYVAENVTGSDLYLFNRLYHDLRDDGVFDVDPDLVYVDTADGVLHLSKCIPDLPENVLAEVLIVPCVTPLAAGGKVVESFRLSLPPQRMNPYLSHLHAPVESFDAVVFSLGYCRASDLRSGQVETVRSIAGLALHVEMTAAQQLVVRTGPVSANVVSTPAARTCPRCGAATSPGSRFCTQCGAPLQAK